MAKFLLQSVRIIDPANDAKNSGSTGSWHEKQGDILIEEGKITAISSKVTPPSDAEVIALSNMHVSPGWFDLGASLHEPGMEHQEDMVSLGNAATSGGFTDLALISHTSPPIQSKEGIYFVKGWGSCLFPTLHPIASVSKNGEGRQITEMVDLHHAGAKGFADKSPEQYGMDILKTALLYLQTVNSPLMVYPSDKTLEGNGQMHEGSISTSLGLPGIPSVSEEMAVQRYLSLLEYTGGKLHFRTLSSKRSIELVRQGKKKGLQVTCDVAAHQMSFLDEDLQHFDTNLKVYPPFREQEDREALWLGISDGTIDAIVSAHTPLDTESKELEFDLASFGIIGLETAFATAVSNCPKELSLDRIIYGLTHGPRKVLGIDPVRVEVGAEAKLTFFDPDLNWTYSASDIQSKSKNSPFVGKKLKGKPLGGINGGQLLMGT